MRCWIMTELQQQQHWPFDSNPVDLRVYAIIIQTTWVMHLEVVAVNQKDLKSLN